MKLRKVVLKDKDASNLLKIKTSNWYRIIPEALKVDTNAEINQKGYCNIEKVKLKEAQRKTILRMKQIEEEYKVKRTSIEKQKCSLWAMSMQGLEIMQKKLVF